MNDHDLIMELRPEAPLPEPGRLAPARARLTAAITAERADDCAPGPLSPGAERYRPAGTHIRRRPAPWPVRRPALVGLSAALAAAAVATTLVVMPGHRGPSAVGRAPGSSATAVPPPGTVNVTAARFLLNAAAAARLQHASPPGPGQFVFTEIEGAGGADKDQLWLSAYGNRDGLTHNAGQRSYVMTPCTVAQTQVAQKSPPGVLPSTYHCAEAAGYLPSMPADPQKVLAYLYKIHVAQPPDPDASEPGWETNDLGKAIDFLMQTTYLRPAQQAALFDLMAQTPGFTVVHGARDAVGRVGVAIKWTFEGAPAEIILNPSTYAYLGDRTWPAPGFHGPGANDYDGGALVKIAFVDKAGQLP